MTYSDSRKSFPNGVALLDKPAVAPTSESVTIFENRYKPPVLGTVLSPSFLRKQESSPSQLFWTPVPAPDRDSRFALSITHKFWLDTGMGPVVNFGTTSPRRAGRL